MEARAHRCLQPGSFTSVLAGPAAQHPPASLNRTNGRAACPAGTGDRASDTKTEQEKRQRQAAGERVMQAGSVQEEGVW